MKTLPYLSLPGLKPAEGGLPFRLPLPDEAPAGPDHAIQRDRSERGGWIYKHRQGRNENQRSFTRRNVVQRGQPAGSNDALSS